MSFYVLYGILLMLFGAITLLQGSMLTRLSHSQLLYGWLHYLPWNMYTLLLWFISSSSFLNDRNPCTSEDGENVMWVPESYQYQLNVPGSYGCDSECVDFKHNFRVIFSNIWINSTIEWMPEDIVDCKSTLVQVMAWCHFLDLYRPQGSNYFVMDY